MDYYVGQVTKEEFERYRQEFLLVFGTDTKIEQKITKYSDYIADFLRSHYDSHIS